MTSRAGCAAGAALILVLAAAVAFAQPRVGPDAAVGTEEERLASTMTFESTGVLRLGEGFTASVRIEWSGTAGFMARTNYRTSTPQQLLAAGTAEAARAAFYNFTASAVRPEIPEGGLPTAIEYDIREAMAFGNGGRTLSFYVPMLRAFRRIPPTTSRTAATPEMLKALPEAVRKVAEAAPPPGVLPVFDLGRLTLRATYEIPEGARATAPPGRRVETDFADFTSSYSVEGRRIRAERTLIVKTLVVSLDREPDLASFFKEVEADRVQTFRIEFLPSNRSEADRLSEEGTAAIDRKALPEAIEILQRATQSDPDHRFAWCNLGSAHLGLRNGPQAVQALERALAVNPGDPFVRSNLGQAYELVGRLEDAEKTLKEQVDLVPHSAWALQTIAGFYARQGRFAESVPYGERAADAAPDHDGTPLSLGHSYLAIGRVDEAVRAFLRGTRASRNGKTLNEAAWTLAERGVGLDAAGTLIDAALDKVVASTTPASLAAQLPAIEATEQIGAMWDTAGWIRFKQGDAAGAVPWLDAAWQITNRAEVAEHLGDALARLERTEEAAIAYTWASDSANPTTGAIAKHTASTGQRVAEIRRIAAERFNATQRLSFAGAATGSGEVLVVYDRAGRPLTVQALGPAVPPAAVEALRSQTIPVTAPPDGRPYRLARKATLSCADGSCTLIWSTSPR